MVNASILPPGPVPPVLPANPPPWDQLLLRWRGPLAIPLGIGYSVAVRLLLAIFVGLVAGILISTHLMTVDSLKKFFDANRPNVDALVDVSALKHNALYFWLNLTLVSFVVGGFREELWRSSFLAGVKALFPGHFGSVRGQV